MLRIVGRIAGLHTRPFMREPRFENLNPQPQAVGRKPQAASGKGKRAKSQAPRRTRNSNNKNKRQGRHSSSTVLLETNRRSSPVGPIHTYPIFTFGRSFMMYFGSLLSLTTRLLLLRYLFSFVYTFLFVSNYKFDAMITFQNIVVGILVAGLSSIFLNRKKEERIKRVKCIKMGKLLQLQPNDDGIESFGKLPFIVAGCGIEFNYTNYFLNYFEEKDYTTGTNRWKYFHFMEDKHLALDLTGVQHRDWYKYAPNVAATVFLMRNSWGDFEEYRDALLDLTDGITISDGVRLAIVVEGCDGNFILTNGDIKKQIQYYTLQDRLGPTNVFIFRTGNADFAIGYDSVLAWIKNGKFHY